jgi:thiol-disulfide isomerase/thioredoxin
MPYLVAAIIVFSALCVVNLLLTTAVVRRLRAHTEALAELGAARPGTTMAAGTQLTAFSATTVDDRTVSSEQLLDGPGLVGFFSPDCRACREQLPIFIQHARTYPGDRSRVIAVVNGDAAQASHLLGPLGEVASVVVERGRGGLSGRFRVEAYPTFYALDERLQVAAAGHSASELPVPLPT